jgi:hypothetical protein
MQARTWKKLSNIINREWSPESAQKFVDKLDPILELLANSPFIGMKSNKREEVRQILITHHNRLLFLIRDN